MQFGLKTMLAFAAVLAIAIPVTRWFRADTIFHANSSFVICFPDGSTIPTNHWIRRPSDFDFSFLQSDQAGQYNMIQHTDSSKIATIMQEGEKFAAVVKNFRVRGPSYRGEYWVTLGKVIDIATK